MKRNLWQDNISRAALSPTPQGMFFWGETMGMWLKWGQRLKTRLMSAASAAIAWQPHRDQGTPRWITRSAEIQTGKGEGTDLWDRGGENLSWRCLWHHFPGNVACRQDAWVLGKESLPAARAAGLTGLWGHGRKLERESSEPLIKYGKIPTLERILQNLQRDNAH